MSFGVKLGDESIVTVDNIGDYVYVMGMNPGTADVTVTAGTFTQTCKVTVTED